MRDYICIAGDQIGHLWWRMLNGQLPRKPPKVAVVLIGTNDLYAVSECTQESEIELVASVKDIRSRCTPFHLQPPHSTNPQNVFLLR